MDLRSIILSCLDLKAIVDIWRVSQHFRFITEKYLSHCNTLTFPKINIDAKKLDTLLPDRLLTLLSIPNYLREINVQKSAEYLDDFINLRALTSLIEKNHATLRKINVKNIITPQCINIVLESVSTCPLLTRLKFGSILSEINVGQLTVICRQCPLLREFRYEYSGEKDCSQPWIISG
jgi:hypothetical protein